LFTVLGNAAPRTGAEKSREEEKTSFEGAIKDTFGLWAMGYGLWAIARFARAKGAKT
jgi:hypothetical protein